MLRKANTGAPSTPPGLQGSPIREGAPQAGINSGEVVAHGTRPAAKESSATPSRSGPGISSPTIAATYATHWRERLAVSVRFDRRENWCWS
jgi:hypothetical protein